MNRAESYQEERIRLIGVMAAAGEVRGCVNHLQRLRYFLVTENERTRRLEEERLARDLANKEREITAARKEAERRVVAEERLRVREEHLRREQERQRLEDASMVDHCAECVVRSVGSFAHNFRR